MNFKFVFWHWLVVGPGSISECNRAWRSDTDSYPYKSGPHSGVHHLNLSTSLFAVRRASMWFFFGWTLTPKWTFSSGISKFGGGNQIMWQSGLQWSFNYIWLAKLQGIRLGAANFWNGLLHGHLFGFTGNLDLPSILLGRCLAFQSYGAESGG